MVRPNNHQRIVPISSLQLQQPPSQRTNKSLGVVSGFEAMIFCGFSPPSSEKLLDIGNSRWQVNCGTNSTLHLPCKLYVLYCTVLYLSSHLLSTVGAHEVDREVYSHIDFYRVTQFTLHWCDTFGLRRHGTVETLPSPSPLNGPNDIFQFIQFEIKI